jgi:hypothetical protein
MKNDFEQTRFTIEKTDDGSPTLRLPDDGESMHHSGGAASETDYIYKSVIEAALKTGTELKMAVVGLGLGYIEISWAITCLRQSGFKSRFISFETDEGLKSNFLNWVKTGEPVIYNEICKFMGPDDVISDIRALIEENLRSNPIRGDFLSEYDKDNSYHLICFDAFSRKTTEDLWTENFLEEFLQKSCHENCILTTYACTGALKRALKKNNFRLLERTRFKGKRDSTLAVRGIFNSSALIFRTS